MLAGVGKCLLLGIGLKWPTHGQNGSANP